MSDSEKYRITARILREDGTEKTVTFRGNFAIMDKTMRTFFHAVKYKLYKVNDVSFSKVQEWKDIKTDAEIAEEIKKNMGV